MPHIIRKFGTYIYGHKKAIGILSIAAAGLFFFTPIPSYAIFFLLLLPVGIANVIAVMIIEAVFWCLVAFCNNGDVGAVSINVCNVTHPDHSKILPVITFDANFTNANPWGQREDAPGPSDRTELSWDAATSTSCWLTTPDDPGVRVATNVSSSTTYIPGELTAPGIRINIELYCENAYSAGGVSCTTNATKKYFLTIPPPNMGDPETFTVTPKVVRYGGTAQFDWKITAGGTGTDIGVARDPYRLNCEIKGALGGPYTFNTIALPSGFRATQAVTSSAINTLTCIEPISAGSSNNLPGTATSTTNKLEVIPRTYEI